MSRGSDHDWERFGRRCPYFGVYADDRFRDGGVGGEDLEEFFRSGEEWVSTVFEMVENHFLRPFRPGSSLDFGCGVGRIVIPLCARSGEVCGVDVSPSMLEEARKNLLARSIGNARLLESDDGLTRLGEMQFDFVHSVIVFQHIPVRRGMRILERLLYHLKPGGIGVLHFTYHRQASLWRKAGNRLRAGVPFVNGLANLLSGRNFGDPMAQMHLYNPKQLFGTLSGNGVDGFHARMTDHSGYRGIVLSFRKGEPHGR
jgi:SAM-dependent methyltransferase